MVSSFLLDELNRFSITSDHSTIVVTLNKEFTALAGWEGTMSRKREEEGNKIEEVI